MLININTIGAFIISILLLGLVLHPPKFLIAETFLIARSYFFQLTFLAVQIFFFYCQSYQLASNFSLWTIPLFLLNGITFLIHEAGHVYWSWGGDFLMSFGGTLNEILFPLALTFYFLFKSYNYLSALMIYWLGLNMIGISFYMADAVSQKLTLVGGGTHDWNFIFSKFQLLPKTAEISNLTYNCGILICLLSFTFYSLNFFWIKRANKFGIEEI